MNRDPQGHPRDIPVRIGGKHAGLIVWHSKPELARYMKGLDPLACRVLPAPSDDYRRGEGR